MTPTDDPRERLSGSANVAGAQPAIAAPEFIDFTASQGVGAARGQNFVLAVDAAGAGPLEWNDDLGYIVIGVADESRLVVTHDSGTVSLTGRGIVTVPPGRSTVVQEAAVDSARLFPAASAAAVRLAENADSYATPHPRVTECAPVSGEVSSLRAHPLSDYPPEPGRFGTIFRTETLMVNFIPDAQGPRDPEALSPHHHDDFEQGSFSVAGTWEHHIRTPWTKQRSQWRDDIHRVVDGTTLTIIPPPTEHTSQAIGAGLNRLIDLFSPARSDFEEQGWVVNARDYSR